MAISWTKMVADAVRGVTTGERVDGDLIKTVHPYRRLMAHIMPGRNESVVYYDTYARAEKLMAYIAEASERFHVDVTHCLVAAGTIGLSEAPKMNRFVAGRRMYQRKSPYITFSMKRQKLGHEAKLAAVKLEMPKGETFRELCARINGDIKVERSGKRTSADKEFDLLQKLPRAALDVAVSALRGLDHFGALPWAFIKNDAMYTSMFIANLGSVGMAAGYHHLYEWGNCPLFMMVGRAEDRAIVGDDGQVEVARVLPIRWSFDERVEDGFATSHGIASVNRALENPYEYFGCLKDDGSDAPALSRPALR